MTCEGCSGAVTRVLNKLGGETEKFTCLILLKVIEEEESCQYTKVQFMPFAVQYWILSSHAIH